MDMLGYADLNARLHVRRIARHQTATRLIEHLHDRWSARDPERAERALGTHLDRVLKMLTTVASPKGDPPEDA
ncbi:MAG TPA: hypothetical protein VH969_18955 [Actinophytocola sp.]|jgi:hypothetical protein|uniref:hypothetical protein n=1 Tax=Actinophytocola sp. TaxID=1872138 RepID=UPI002F92BD7A